MLQACAYVLVLATKLGTFQGFVSGRCWMKTATQSDSFGGPGILGWQWPMRGPHTSPTEGVHEYPRLGSVDKRQTYLPQCLGVRP